MGAQLERIIDEGTRDREYSSKGKPSNIIRCVDGFKLSVIAGGGAYCIPRDAEGPFVAVEAGFPSERPEPWATWSEFAEDGDAPTETVYGYVPVEHVRALIDSHGGEA